MNLAGESDKTLCGLTAGGAAPDEESTIEAYKIPPIVVLEFPPLSWS